jgi:hypothetical protein
MLATAEVASKQRFNSRVLSYAILEKREGERESSRVERRGEGIA